LIESPYDQVMSERAIDDGWTPIEGVGEPDEQHVMSDLDLVPDLTHPIRGAIVRRLRQPKSVAQLADELDSPITRLYHHINRLEEVGLIRVVATRRVAAVTERRYQVSALSFTFSDDAFEGLDRRELSSAFASLFDVAKIGLQREIEHGLLEHRDADNPTFALTYTDLRLLPDQRSGLLDELQQVFDRYVEISKQNLEHPDAERLALFFSAYPEH